MIPEQGKVLMVDHLHLSFVRCLRNCLQVPDDPFPVLREYVACQETVDDYGFDLRVLQFIHAAFDLFRRIEFAEIAGVAGAERAQRGKVTPVQFAVVGRKQNLPLQIQLEIFRNGEIMRRQRNGVDCRPVSRRGGIVSGAVHYRGLEFSAQPPESAPEFKILLPVQ